MDGYTVGFKGITNSKEERARRNLAFDRIVAAGMRQKFGKLYKTEAEAYDALSDIAPVAMIELTVRPTTFL